MNINHYIYFIEAVKENNITKAAKSLFVSQSTISKAIRSLEKVYSTELVDRTAKNFRLTSSGETFYNSAVKIVSNFQTENEILSALLNSKRGTLTLGVPPVTITAIHSILYQYQSMYPEIIMRISEIGAKTAYALTKSGAIDIGVVIQPFTDPDFIQIPLMYSEAVCIVPLHHRFANYESISFEQLQREKFLLLNDTFMLYDRVIECCQKAGFYPHIALESGQWDLLVEAVANGRGITILPKPIIDKFCSSKIKTISLKDPELPWVPTVAYHKEKFLSAPMKLFLEMIEKRKSLT